MSDISPSIEHSVERFLIQAKNCVVRDRRDIAEKALSSALLLANTRSLVRSILLYADRNNFTNIKDLALKRITEIEGLDETDPVVRDWRISLALYEELLSVKNGRTQPAGRTRQKIKNDGLMKSLEDWSLYPLGSSSDGFDLLVAHGYEDLTAEAIVCRHPHRFREEAVANAIRRLEALKQTSRT